MANLTNFYGGITELEPATSLLNWTAELFSSPKEIYLDWILHKLRVEQELRYAKESKLIIKWPQPTPEQLRIVLLDGIQGLVKSLMFNNGIPGILSEVEESLLEIQPIYELQVHDKHWRKIYSMVQ